MKKTADGTEIPKILDILPMKPGQKPPKRKPYKRNLAEVFRKENLAECWTCRYLSNNTCDACVKCMERHKGNAV